MMEETTDMPKPHRGPAKTNRGGRLLTATEAASYLGFPYRTFTNMVRRGLFPVVRVPDSRKMWFDRADLDRAVNAWKERLS